MQESIYIGRITFHSQNYIIHQISDSISQHMNLEISCVGKKLQEILPELASQVQEQSSQSDHKANSIYFSANHAETLEDNRFFKAVIHSSVDAPQDLLQADLYDITSELRTTLEETTLLEESFLSYWRDGYTIVWTTDSHLRIISAVALGQENIKRLHHIEAGMPLFEFLDRYLPRYSTTDLRIDQVVYINKPEFDFGVSIKLKPIIDTEDERTMGCLAVAVPSKKPAAQEQLFVNENMHVLN